MNFKKIFLAFALLCSILLYSQSPGDVDRSFTGFNSNELFNNQNTLNGVNKSIHLPNGKILIAGHFNQYQGIQTKGIARINANGIIDTSFVSPFTNEIVFITSIAIQPDNKILVSGGPFNNNNGLIRLNEDGSVDGTFNIIQQGFTGGGVEKVLVQSDGKILVCGSFNSYNGISKRAIMRFNSDGSVDSLFNSYGVGFNQGSFLKEMLLQQDGKILVRGNFNSYNGTSFNNNSGTIRLNNDGSLDTTFYINNTNTLPIYINQPILLQPNGNIIIAHITGYNNDVATSGIVRMYNSNGVLLSSYQLRIGVHSLGLQPDGKILIGMTNSILRLESDLVIDTSFYSPSINGIILNFSFFPDGKILVGGQGTVSYNNIIASLYSSCQYISPPEVNSSYTYSIGDDLSDLGISGENILWFSDENLRNSIPSNTLISSNTNYYVVNSIGRCRSNYSIVRVACPILDEPTTINEIIYLENSTLADIYIPNNFGILEWFDNENLTNQIQNNTVVELGSTYYVRRNYNGCYSEVSSININCPQILPPSNSQSLIIYQENQSVYQIPILQYYGSWYLENVLWFYDEDLEIPVNYNDEIIDGHTYYVISYSRSCTSSATPITLVSCSSYAQSNIPIGESTQYFEEGDRIADLIVQGENLFWYSISSDDGIGYGLDINTPLFDGMILYVRSSFQNCISNPLQIEVRSTLNILQNEINKVQIYPNPTQNILNITSDNTINEVKILDMSGRILQKNFFENNEVILDISNLPSAQYQIIIKQNDNEQNYKILKK